MESERLKSILESLIFVSDEPVPLQRLGQLVGMKDKKALKAALDELRDESVARKGGIELIEVAGGYQFRTNSENSQWVNKLFEERPQKLTRPSLETLAIVAYRQPITRMDAERIRGVDSGGVLKTLLERNLLRIVGRSDAPGRPVLYGTTTEFLEFFGLKDLNDLPPLRDIAELGDATEEMIAEYAKREGIADLGIPGDPTIPGDSPEAAGDANPPADTSADTPADNSTDASGDEGVDESSEEPPPDPMDEDYGSDPDGDDEDDDDDESEGEKEG